MGFGPPPSNLWFSNGEAKLALNNNPPNINIFTSILFISRVSLLEIPPEQLFTGFCWYP